MDREHSSLGKTGSTRYENPPAEPGIIRNPTGRIIATGWPYIPKRDWMVAYREIGKALKQQIQYEHTIEEHAGFDLLGALRLGKAVFNLYDITLRDDIQQELERLINDPSIDIGNIVRWCDLGGASGNLIGNGAHYQKGKYKKPNQYGRNLRTTLTRLSTLGESGIWEWYEYIDEIKTTSVELPPDDFYQAFNLISCQNSVFHWSRFPELATFNLWKMLKKSGIVLATLPAGGMEFEGEESFDIFGYLQSTSLFTITNIKEFQGSQIIRMEKNK